MLKLEMCRLHPIALHGFDFLKTHTLLFHFAGGCCNGSNSHRGERSRWTCSGRCATLSKNDWSDFVQCLWSGFKGNYGNSWFCDILCLFCSGTFHQKNNKNFQPYCGDSSQPSSTFTPHKQQQTNPTSECIFSFPFLLAYHCTWLYHYLTTKKDRTQTYSHMASASPPHPIHRPWHPRWKWSWWKWIDTSHDVGVRQTALWDDLWSNQIHWTIETMPSWFQVLVHKNKGDGWLYGNIYKMTVWIHVEEYNYIIICHDMMWKGVYRLPIGMVIKCGFMMCFDSGNWRQTCWAYT